MSTYRILVTGGCGFAGHHLVEHLLKNTDWDIVVLDRLTYASSGFDRLREIDAFEDSRVHIFTEDITAKMSPGAAKEIGKVDYIAHLAAETHVDNSIENAEPFVWSNVMGTYRMLEFARTQSDLIQFVNFGTDEVFGPAPEGIFYKEWDRYNSTNPYSATKAGAEELALAYANTYGVPVLCSHTMNLVGERQHREKFVPLVIRKVLLGETVAIHADKTKTQAGKRHYLHCRNMAAALLFLLEQGQVRRDKINIVGEKEYDNLSLAQLIAGFVGKPLKYEMVSWHESRPGHDLRYALDGTKLSAMGFKYPVGFEQSLEKTVRWTLDHPHWLGL